VVVEFAAHDSKLQFGVLNHVRQLASTFRCRTPFGSPLSQTGRVFDHFEFCRSWPIGGIGLKDRDTRSLHDMVFVCQRSPVKATLKEAQWPVQPLSPSKALRR
jgi:hypothetical protein